MKLACKDIGIKKSEFQNILEKINNFGLSVFLFVSKKCQKAKPILQSHGTTIWSMYRTTLLWKNSEKMLTFNKNPQ